MFNKYNFVSNDYLQNDIMYYVWNKFRFYLLKKFCVLLCIIKNTYPICRRDTLVGRAKCLFSY